MSWREKLKKMAQVGKTEEFPLSVYKVNPPSIKEWDTSLPAPKAVLDFYNICDGGLIDDYRFSRVAELRELNDFWTFNLQNYYGEGTNPLVEGQHLVLAIDSAGAPLIWDKQTDLMATFWFKGGDWESLEMSFEDLMSKLFSPDKSEDIWYEALQLLDNRLN